MTFLPPKLPAIESIEAISSKLLKFERSEQFFP